MVKSLFILLIVASSNCFCQQKEHTVCVATELHKGKVNHGKPYCVEWAIVVESKDGRKDTVAWSFSDKMQWGDEIGKYDKLSERGKYIVDSLKEDGVTQYQDDYLTYEPIFMKVAKKIERLWRIEGQGVIIYEYLFWKNSNGQGIRLLKEFDVK